jgi:hypothetical protein
MPPSDSLPPSAPAPVPLAGGLPRCGCVFCALWADDTCTRLPVVRRRRVTGAPRDRHVSRRGEGLPGSWTVLCVRALVEHPAGDAPLLARFSPGALLPSMTSRSLGIRQDERFRGRSPTARTCACRRLAGRVSTTGARLAPGSGGLTLSRAGCAPAGRHTKFPEGIATSNPL